MIDDAPSGPVTLHSGYTAEKKQANVAHALKGSAWSTILQLFFVKMKIAPLSQIDWKI